MKIDLKVDGSHRYFYSQDPIPICKECKYRKYDQGFGGSGSFCLFRDEIVVLNPISGEYTEPSSVSCRDCREDISINGCGPFGFRFKSL